MPFKSKAQRRKFAELLVNGKISDQTYEEWNRSTGKKELPERLHPEAVTKNKTTARKKTTKKAAAKKRTTKRR
jgi:3-deoxy-D-manno-octulosonic-acid transferase